MILLLLSIPLFFGCSSQNTSSDSSLSKATDAPSPTSLIVGFSQMNHINPWRVAETNDMKREAAERGITLLVADSDSSLEKQTQDVRDLIYKGADYIVCTPFVYHGYEEIVSICRQAGVPLIILDREIEGTAGKDFLTFIGSNFFEEGRRIAQWLAKATNYSARIVEIHGNYGASCDIDRERGFHDFVDPIDTMVTVASGYADYERIKGQKVMEEIILSYGRDFNAVYAYSDEMAIGAIQALKAANFRPGIDVTIVSVDGSKDALKSIIAGELGATVECNPRLAKLVFDAIESHLAGETLPAKIIVEDRLFDSSNALELFDEAF